MQNKYRWIAVWTVCFSIGFNLTAFAKPQNENELAKLQQQVEQLQAQLKRRANRSSDDENSLKASERVRNVGQQIVRRAPRGTYEQDIALQIRLYDLSDLFAVSPNYPATVPNELEARRQFFANAPSNQRQMSGGGGFGGGGGGVFSIPATQFAAPIQESQNLNMQSAQVTLDQLVGTIKETVKPEMWGKTPTSARIKFLGNTLLITATEEMHTQINHLLNLFREHWGKRRTVSVQTWWIRADHGAASELIDQATSEKIGAGVVDKGRWKEFFRKAKEANSLAYSATLTGHNNQTLHAVSGKQVSLTIDADPYETNDIQWHVKDFDNLDAEPADLEADDHLVSENYGFLGQQKKIIGFRPLRARFHSGAAVQLTPLATRGGNFVILDLQAKLNELVPNDRRVKIAVDQGEKETSIELDNTDYQTCRFSSTLRCPKDQVVLAGSMTFKPGEDGETSEILIFVRTLVHTIAEDQSDWKKSTVVMPGTSKLELTPDSDQGDK